MPESKSRAKKKNTRYNLTPSRKKKADVSPRWFGPTMLAVMFLGVALIVLNYVGLLPTTNGTADPKFLFVGLVMIGGGFVGTTFWR